MGWKLEVRGRVRWTCNWRVVCARSQPVNVKFSVVRNVFSIIIASRSSVLIVLAGSSRII